jgi:magnesium chelatase accessory protein
MSTSLSSLLKCLALQPEIYVGHSAGAAIAVQMALSGQVPAPTQIVAINGAFLPFGGPAASLLSPLTRLLHASPWVPELFSRRANEPAVVRRLVEGTGSVLDDDGLALYARLIRNPAHARSALGMMAHWDLRDLQRRLPELSSQLDLLVGAGDRAVPARQARRVKARRPQTRLIVMPGLGHLAHEEAPAEVARLLLDWTRSAAVRS